MWLPIVGFCYGVVYDGNAVAMGQSFAEVSPTLYYVRNVSVKVTKAGPEWYDGYKFEVRFVTTKKIDQSPKCVMTLRNEYSDKKNDVNLYEFYYNRPFSYCNGFVWGNHVGYVSESVVLNKEALERLYIYTFQGVQLFQDRRVLLSNSSLGRIITGFAE